MGLPDPILSLFPICKPLIPQENFIALLELPVHANFRTLAWQAAPSVAPPSGCPIRRPFADKRTEIQGS
jgi:hypothetical protein